MDDSLWIEIKQSSYLFYIKLTSGQDSEETECCIEDKLEHLEVETDGRSGQKNVGGGITPCKTGFCTLLEWRVTPNSTFFYWSFFCDVASA